MRTFYSLNDFLRSKPASKKFIVTVGVFDGIHRAHKRLLNSLIKKARKRHFLTLVITFNPHPANVLDSSKKVPLLISLKHRLCFLEELGIDHTIVLGFNKRLSQMNAASFIKAILCKVGIDEIIVGRNFFFGRNKNGSLNDLKKFSRIYGFRVSAIDTAKSSGRVISSTWIRSLILKGNLKKASKLLLKPVTVLGTVIKGHKRGRILGYPTANIDPHHEAIPPSGVYAVKIRLKNVLYQGILNIGVRPTFKKGSGRSREPTIEVHIFDFNKSIYGKDLEIIFAKKIRKEKKFRDALQLKQQIEEDEKRARQILR